LIAIKKKLESKCLLANHYILNYNYLYNQYKIKKRI